MGIIVSGTSITFNDSSVQTTAAGGSSTGSRGQVFTSTGVFTIPAGVSTLKVTVVGGGGSGASVTGSVTSGGGGGAGGVAIKYVTGLTPGETVTVTVGGISGTSSFGAFCSATGGVSPATVTSSNSNGPGGAGGTGSGGDINLTGGAGASGSYVSGGVAVCMSGAGGGVLCSATPGKSISDTPVSFSTPGAGMFGFGGAGSITNTTQNGNPATGYGNGGSGSITLSTADATGGAGVGGIVIVEW